MNAVDWSRWLELAPQEREELRRRFREIVKVESDAAKASNYAAMNAALAGRAPPKRGAA